MNIPLVEELEKMSSFIKFMKDLVTKKRTMSFESIDIVHHCSAIASRCLVEKKKDSRDITISCTIGPFNFSKALCDLGDSISLMPLAVTNSWGWDFLNLL